MKAVGVSTTRNDGNYWGRVIRFQFGDPGFLVEYDSREEKLCADLEFDIEFRTRIGVASGTAKIYNPTPEMIKAAAAGSLITIEAGYGDDAASVYQGSILSSECSEQNSKTSPKSGSTKAGAKPGKESAKGSFGVLSMHVGESAGAGLWLNAMINHTMIGPVDMQTLIMQCLAKINIKPVRIKLAKNPVMTGTISIVKLRELIAKIDLECESTYWQTQGQVWIAPKSDHTAKPPSVILSADTGLLRADLVDMRGASKGRMKVQCLFNHRIRGQTIQTIRKGSGEEQIDTNVWVDKGRHTFSSFGDSRTQFEGNVI